MRVAVRVILPGVVPMAPVISHVEIVFFFFFQNTDNCFKTSEISAAKKEEPTKKNLQNLCFFMFLSLKKSPPIIVTDSPILFLTSSKGRKK